VAIAISNCILRGRPVLAALVIVGCSNLLTTEPAPGERFDRLSRGSRTASWGFADGHTQFRKAHDQRGPRPIFNNVSCASCHSGDGRGVTGNTLTRFSRGTDLDYAEGGPQLQDKAVPGAAPERLPSGVDVSYRLPPPSSVGLIEAITDSRFSRGRIRGFERRRHLRARELVTQRPICPPMMPAEARACAWDASAERRPTRPSSSR
jgi:hypothetical protein